MHNAPRPPRPPRNPNPSEHPYEVELTIGAFALGMLMLYLGMSL